MVFMSSIPWHWTIITFFSWGCCNTFWLSDFGDDACKSFMQNIYIRTVNSKLLLCSGKQFSFLAVLGQKSNILCMLICPKGQKNSFNWLSNCQKNFTVLMYTLCLYKFLYNFIFTRTAARAAILGYCDAKYDIYTQNLSKLQFFCYVIHYFI